MRRASSFRRPTSQRRRVRLAVVATAVCAAIAALPGSWAKADSTSGVRVLGKLATDPSETGIPSVVALDGERRLMYYMWKDPKFQWHLRQFDIRPTMPRVTRDAVVPGTPFTFQPGRNTTAFDSRRNKLVLVDIEEPNTGTILRRLDLSSFKPESNWNLSTKVPGFIGIGITYSARDDRFYVLGEMSVNGGTVHNAPLSTPVRLPAGPPTVVVAVDASSTALNVSWIRPVPQCLGPLQVFAFGGYIGASTQRNALYFFCISGGVGEYATFPGVTGLIRITTAPKATQADALSFPVEFLPASGAFTGASSQDSGDVGMDHPTDRVFVQSLSATTPGAWAFDGTISAWVGLIAAPDSNDEFVGVNEKSGHYYIGTALTGANGKGYLIVSNARMTPPPQGDVFPLQVTGPITTDPGGKRLFVPFFEKSGREHFYVLEDNTPDPQPLDPVNYDDLTTDIAENANTISTYAGSLNGYGARSFLVGGVGGATSFLSVSDIYGEYLRDAQNILKAPLPGISPGDRGLYFARVASVDLRNSGAAASGQAVAPDVLTDADIGNIRNLVAGKAGSPTESASKAIAWPYPAATCLDGSGQAVKMDGSGPGGDATVNCDLSKNESTAISTFSGATLGPITIGASSFTTSSFRDLVNGAATEATAISKGIQLDLPGVGSLSIGRVIATAKTYAHGRPGTAKVVYTRKIQDVNITDASGKDVFACAATCDPQKVADAVNSELGIKVRMDVPPPEILATARGAFAGVEKTERDYIGGLAQNNDNSHALPAIQLSINNDSAGKSRILVQLAGIQASSIYGISLLSGDYNGGGGGGVVPPLPVPGPVIVPPIIPPITGPGGGNTGGSFGHGGTVRTSLRGAVLLTRPVKDVAIVMLTFMLIAGACATAYRRQTLIQQLEKES